MRKGYRDLVPLDNDGVFVGVCLGWDFCAEHETGIRTIQQSFGMDESKFGVEKRIIRVISEFLTFRESKRYYLIYFSQSGYDFDYLDKNGVAKFLNMKCELGTPRDEDIYSAAWSYNSFGIAFPKKNKHMYEALTGAFDKKDILIYLGGNSNPSNPSNPFARAGLCIVIASKFPKNIADQMYNIDVEQDQLVKLVKQIGIEEELKRSGRRWFALTPHRPKVSNSDGTYKAFGDSERITKYNVVFWLNPVEQQKYNSNWCTVEDLKEWSYGKGPIVKATIL